jgi:hypothetical protein
MRFFFWSFIVVCVVHLSEHVAQMIQLYAYNMPLHKSGGILGKFYPWLAHSETLHYGYALFMWVGLFILRNQFTGSARWWWMLAFYIQTWHHFEHVLLLGQALSGVNFLNAPQPISVIQFIGLLNGPAETGFGGLLKMSHFGECTCQGAKPGTVHEWSAWLLVVRRPEVHMMYNMLVTVPMVVAMLKNKRVTPDEVV